MNAHIFNPHKELSDIVDSEFFRWQAERLSEEELLMMKNIEKISKKIEYGKKRKTGGPAYRHFKEILFYFLDAAKQYEKNTGNQYKIPIHMFFGLVMHDSLENEPGIRDLLKRYHNGTDEERRKLNPLIEKRREDALQSFRTELLEKLKDTTKESPQYIIDEITEGSDLIYSLTRPTEKIFFHQYVYDLFSIHGEINTGNRTRLLKRSLIKLCDRISNQASSWKKYTDHEESVLCHTISKNKEYLSKYGEQDFKGQNLSYSAITHSIWKSLIVINALNSTLLNKYDRDIQENRTEEEKQLLWFIKYTKDRLVETARDTLNEMIDRYSNTRFKTEKEKDYYTRLIHTAVQEAKEKGDYRKLTHPSQTIFNNKDHIKRAHNGLIARWAELDTERRGGMDFYDRPNNRIRLYSDWHHMLELVNMFSADNKTFNDPKEHRYFHIGGLKDSLSTLYDPHVNNTHH